METKNDIELRISQALTQLFELPISFGHGHEDLFSGMNLTEVHCIDCIGTIDHANVTKISKKMDMTRGAISKICKKLIAKDAIQAYEEPDNNKEVYYSLTEKGNEIYTIHKRIHKEMISTRIQVIDKYQKSEKETILRFLHDIFKVHSQ